MLWRVNSLQEQFINGLSLVIFLVILIGFFVISPLFIFIGLVYSVFLFLSHYYEKHIGEKLILKNEKHKYRYFIGEEGEIVLHFKNEGLPIIAGKLNVFFKKNIQPKGAVDIEEESKVTVPITFIKGGTYHVHLPVQMVKRGVGRIIKIQIQVTNLFGFSELLLEFNEYWQEEYIIYPKITPISYFQLEPILKEGNVHNRYSLFEERLHTIGSRDYLPGDSFNMVHWKASSKTNSLQTKVFEKTTNANLLIIINVSESYWWNEKIEEMISSVAYLIQEAVKNHIPVSLAANIRFYGDFPFLYIPPGEGKAHFQKMLEMLAILDTHQLILPHEEMLYYLYKKQISETYCVHAGLLSSTQEVLLRRLVSHNQKLYQLTIDIDHAMLVKIS